ncbi:MAG: DUF86 domain-containing protein [Candidatus Omnitrophota bacterium]|jgi:hypothetical protein
MKKRTSKLYLKDILDSIKNIQSYTKKLNFNEFSQKKIVIDAVIRNFEIIGEAAKNIPNDIKSSHRGIPWKEMAGMRDKIIHEYFGVDLDIVWQTIQSLPDLETLLKKIHQTK